MTRDISEKDNDVRQASYQWVEIIGQLVDRLTGKGASVTYTFDNLIIDVPRARGPGGQELGSAKWTISGKVMIAAEAQEVPGITGQTSKAASTV